MIVKVFCFTVFIYPKPVSLSFEEQPAKVIVHSIVMCKLFISVLHA